MSQTDQQGQAGQPEPGQELPRSDARDPAHDEVDSSAGDASPDAAATGGGGDPTPAGAEQADDPASADPANDPPSAEQPSPPAELVPEDPNTPLLIRRAPRVRTVDFSQPNKFTVELRRRIVRVLGPFCEAFAIRLSSELRAPVELTVADSSQLTWSAAKAQLPAHAIAVALEVQQIERQMLLGIEPSLILQALECLLGGAAEQAPAERKLSEIDWALTRRLLESMTAQLNQAWRDLGGLQLALGEVDLEGEAGVIAPIGEPTFALKLESTIDGLPSTMSLLIPWSAIAPVADDIFGAGPKPEDADPHEGRAMRRGLAGAHVLLRAEVGSARMPVEQMLALTPGALLALEDRSENGVQLYAEGGPARPRSAWPTRRAARDQADDPDATRRSARVARDHAPQARGPRRRRR